MYPWKAAETYIIAEIGVNHNGSLDLARQLVLAAKVCGANAVKFQTFTAEALVTRSTPKVKYQRETTDISESHFDMIKSLELSREHHRTLFQLCKDQGIDFLSTPYDISSAEFLNDLGVKCFKTASADIIDRPLHEVIARTGKPCIVATGMAVDAEIKSVVELYRELGNNKLILLQCVSNYPCSDESLNLRVITGALAEFGCPVGLSDHSEGPIAATVAVALGAPVIEKHFTLDRSMAGPDHRASADPVQMRELVQFVRRAERMLGQSQKLVQEEEREMAKVSRKSLVSARHIKKGQIIGRQDIASKRPGSGISPWSYPSYLGKKAVRDLAPDELLQLGDFE